MLVGSDKAAPAGPRSGLKRCAPRLTAGHIGRRSNPLGTTQRALLRRSSCLRGGRATPRSNAPSTGERRRRCVMPGRRKRRSSRATRAAHTLSPGLARSKARAEPKRRNRATKRTRSPHRVWRSWLAVHGLRFMVCPDATSMPSPISAHLRRHGGNRRSSRRGVRASPWRSARWPH